ncbi:MAG TPA: DUF3570 domain-containing protein, partial [Thermoanaerobaculia bacterium]
YAKENDYTARAIGLSDSWTMLHGLGTLHFGLAFSRDIVSPVKNPETNPDGLSLDFSKNENGYSLGWTQVLGERDVLDVSASLMQLSGYLTDPYKVVPIGGDKSETLPEQRPDTRSRRALVVKYGHHYLWDGALRMIYRYYNDSWSIQAHTLEVTYDQRIDSVWIVSPQVRLYTQTGASFYGSSFAAPQKFMSADYRLSPLGSILAGLTVGRVLEHHLTVSLGFTWQSQRGRDRVAPTAAAPPPEDVGLAPTPVAGNVSAADMSVLTIVAGFSWRP